MTAHPTSTRIAIVGTCPSSAMLAPFGDERWQIWACSPGNVGKLPRVDAWFELHGDLGWPDPPDWEDGYLAWLDEQPFMLYAQCTGLFRNAMRFPAEELLDEFGPYWFTSTLAWMMAFAIRQGPREIGVYGADLAASSEYARQKPGMTWFIDQAARRGIQVFVPEESDLLRPPPLYGYSIATPMGRKLAVREREIRARLAAAQAKRARLVADLDHEIGHLAGTLDQIDYDVNTWTGQPAPAAPPADVVQLNPRHEKEN